MLKRSIYGTWHHVSVKHLGRYVNEATFRLNEGNVQQHTLDRLAAFASNAFGARITYEDLTACARHSTQSRIRCWDTDPDQPRSR